MDRKRNIVKIRKESYYYFVYFIELRRIITVNRIGATIIDYFFNKNYSINEIVNLINRNRKKGNVINQKDVLEFLSNIKNELNLPYQDGYPIIDKEQMDVPIAVELQINTTCNLRCKHCCQDNYNKIMPLDKVASILKILAQKNIFEISLVGGEVFLHPNILDIVSLCEKYNFAISIVTNGTLLNKSLIKNLKKFKNLAFLISLEGVGEVNDRIRGKGVFARVDQAIKTLKENSIYLEISCTVNAKNIDYPRDLVEYSKSLNIPCNFNLFKPFKSEQNSYIIQPKKYFKFIENIFNERILHNTKVGVTNAAIVAELTNQKPRNECRATMFGLSIDVDGRMVPCPFLKLAGYYNNVQLPKINSSFVNSWKNNKYFQEFRKRSLQECQACSFIFKHNVKAKNPYGINAFLKYRGQKRKYEKIS